MKYIHLLISIFIIAVASGVELLSVTAQSQPFEGLIALARTQGRVSVIVQFDPASGRLSDTRAALAATANGAILSDSANWTIPFVALEVDEIGLRTLATFPTVRGIQPDHAYFPSLESSTPVIRADDAWTRGVTGAGQTVAVLDTGVEAIHPFFGGRVVSEACFSGGGFSDSLCPNGDIIQIGTGAASPQNCVGVGSCAHGTHVAGIAVGQSDTRSGVAHGANLVAIQIFSLLGGLTAYDSNIISALNYVHLSRSVYDIAAVNLSISDGIYQPTSCDDENTALKAAIDQLLSAGIPTVISSGNQGYTNGLTSPSCISTSIAVGATTDTDAIASFSNRAPILDLFAPGASITSSVLNGQFATANGTSMAAPHVTGTFALLRELHPGASVERMLTALKLSGQPIPIEGSVISRIDVIGALDALGGAPLPNRLTNGDFAAGLTGWYLWDGSIVQMPGQWVEWMRTVSSVSAVLAQNTGDFIDAGTGLEARVDFANLTSTRKRVSIILHDADWGDLAMCSFWLDPMTPPRTFMMQVTTGAVWESAQLSLYLSPDDGIGWVRVDNAALHPLLDPPHGVTLCVDPNAPS